MRNREEPASRSASRKSPGTIKNRFNLLLLQKAAKEGKRISLREVARATGININTLSSWLNDRVGRYDADKLATLCQFFGCNLGDLLEYVPPSAAKRE